MTKRKWDYQADYTQWQCLLDEIEFWSWKHMHWLWWAYQGTLQWLRDRRPRRKQEYYNAGFEQGKFEERKRIATIASFTVKLEGNTVIVDAYDWDRLWQALKGEK